MKKIISALSLFSILLTSACGQSDNQLPLLTDNNNGVEISAKKTKNAIRTDWYETLRPDLQAYYAPAKGKTGAALFDALNNVISKGLRVSDYKTAKSFMYSTADNIKVNGKSGVYDAYSYIFVPGSGGDGNSYLESGDENQDGHPRDFINCEHTWPQSFFDKKAPMVADLHHLFPTMSVPNEMRNHYAIGMAKGLVPYTTNTGSKLSLIDKTSKNRTVEQLKQLLSLPHEEKSKILDTEFTITFEPLDRQKGNTARALMYFYLNYSKEGIKQGHFDQEDFWNSKVASFINWSENTDPVDEQEIKRHEIAAKKQGNRNPFIDIPGLGSLISEEVMKSK